MNDIITPTNFGSTSRIERFIVDFNGFIKNVSEGIVRTMLSEQDDWIDRYPHLTAYEGLTNSELYDQTMFYQPMDLLKILSEGKLSEKEIQQDIETITPNIYIDNSEITTFEYALYQLLFERNVEKCYIYKDGKFHQNEINYIIDKYKNILDKVELVDNTNYPSLVKSVNPTTIFVNNPAFPFDYMLNHMTKDEQMGKIVVVLNTTNIIGEIELVDGNPIFDYLDEFLEYTEKVRTTCAFGVSPMFNFRLLEGGINDDR